VGDEFDAVVAAVTSFGLFVELADLYIEGLVHISSLPGDYYHFDSGKQRLTGERSGRSYSLGDAVRVQVARVSLDDKKIDLEMIDSSPGKGAGKKTSKGGQSRGKGKGGKGARDAAAKPASKRGGKKRRTGLRKHQ
jgi:ribonuclease R